ncbi:hypothetical protein LCGC14_3003650 [marine sediment metagenome]|uniref:Uncharacterized protein n=1 Tax=marine sediment metagenome TaxID=412755 RepID=A0A0F8ZRE7_9ZZZZ
MTWLEVFQSILQPILFFGLFIMTFISMSIAIRAEKREIARNRRNIIANAKQIERNYRLLKTAAQSNKKLQEVLKDENRQIDYEQVEE